MLRSKPSFKWTLLITSAIAIGCFSLFLFFLNLDLPGQISFAMSELTSTKTRLPIATNIKLNPIQPIRLKIPSIKVNAIVESVSLTSDGAVGVPKGPKNVAWFSRGPRPGEIGSAIITGHFGYWLGGIPTVFNNLGKLKEGDRLSINDEKGVLTNFVVREVKTYDQNEQVPAVFEAGDQGAHLNLITCTGIWNKILKRYPKRLVVYTDKVIE